MGGGGGGDGAQATAQTVQAALSQDHQGAVPRFVDEDPGDVAALQDALGAHARLLGLLHAAAGGLLGLVLDLLQERTGDGGIRHDRATGGDHHGQLAVQGLGLSDGPIQGLLRELGAVIADEDLLGHRSAFPR